jgi:hypothetical protein
MEKRIADSLLFGIEVAHKVRSNRRLDTLPMRMIAQGSVDCVRQTKQEQFVKAIFAAMASRVFRS